MWSVYEYKMHEDGFMDETFFGYTNDELSAKEMVLRGYIVCDADTLEPFSAVGE